MTGRAGDVFREAARLELGSWPTPLVRARRLEERLGCGPLLVKRDDLSGFALAGGKTRPLEYLLGAARECGHDALVVGGAATSNFCQGAAVAARAAGLDCHLVLPGAPPAPSTVNLAVALACGAQVTFSGGPREELDRRIEDRAGELAAAGGHPLAIPRGGACPRGCLGFVRGARELAGQLAALGHDRARIVLAVGSGGSVAGLLVGAAAVATRQAADWSITGVSVSRPLPALTAQLRRLVTGCAELVGIAPPGPASLRLLEAPGGLHGAARCPAGDAEERESARLALRSEGLVLDAAYTAPAFSAALRLLAEPGPPVVFWHTGGLPAAVGDLLGPAAGGER